MSQAHGVSIRDRRAKYQVMSIFLRALLLILPAFACSEVLAAEPVPVTVQRLGDILVDNERRAPAIVISANRANVTAQVSALIVEVLKDVGDEVAKGEMLIRLDDANARYALAQAKAALAAIEAQIIEASARLTKAEELLEKDFISAEELLSRRANLAVLEANRSGQIVAIKVAELDLRRTRITAPYAAAVVERQAQVGNYAQPGTPLATIVQTDQREIDVDLDPRYAINIPSISELRFSSQGQEWPVKFARLSSVIDRSSRIVKGRFTFDGDSAPIGASGQLVWNELAGLVPAALIVQRGRQLGIFLAISDKAKFVAIPSAQEGRPVAVDMPADTQIVSRGHIRLQDGDSLQIIRE